MIPLRLITILTLFISLPMLISCSTKAQISPEFNNLHIAALAVLPVIDKTELPQGQITAASLAFSQQLRNSGFLVLDNSITQRICPVMPCKNQAPLFNDYLVDATVQLTIESSTQTDILAGYYNDITGSLNLRGKNGEDLVVATRTEREKGGLIFNSGQVLQGLISQVRNDGSSSLLEKLFSNLVSQIPNSNRQIQQNADSTTIAIKTVDVKIISGDRREICVTATPKSLTSLVLGNLKSSLQESLPGRYCRTFFLNPSFRMADAQIEVRSPFGNSVRTGLNLQDASNCDLKQSLTLIADLNTPATISFSCPITPERELIRLLIYKSEGEVPQYSKIGEISGSSWTDSSPTGKSKAQYAVIAKSPRGDQSLPVFLVPADTEAKPANL